MQYYCINCAIAGGQLKPAVPTNLFDTQYQLEKYLKHTAPSSPYGFNSVFSDPSTVAYRNYIVTAVSSGHVQVHTSGRVNVIWVASEGTGISYQNGKFYFNADAVKVVFQDDQFKIHGYPTQSSELVGHACCVCGRVIP
jgi:hypothetical protein